MTLKRQSTSFELTLSLFALLLLGLGVAVWLLIPEAKACLRLQEQVREAAGKSSAMQMEYDRLYEAKEMTETEESLLSDRLENGADAVQLQQWVRTALKDATLEASGGEGGFLVRASVKSPAQFYAFVDRLETAPWILRVEAPVVMRAAGGSVTLLFALRAVTAGDGLSPLQK